jgi:hypothetical protein
VKQKQPAAAWAKKLDNECLQFLAGVRYARWANREIKDPEEARNFVNDVLPKLFPGFAQGRKIAISAELLESLKSAGMPMGENFTPGEHRLPENTARIFENFEMIQQIFNEEDFRKKFPVVAAFGLTFVQDVFSGLALHQFGTEDLSVDQMCWAAGATLEWFGKMLKERKPPDVGKGRANVELLELIRKIRTHETKKLKPKELRQALEYAGYYVSDEEALRLFEWRAKKKGQL